MPRRRPTPTSLRPTMRDVARAAGLSQSAVSLALRDHARVPIKTRERVKRIAVKLGYRADARVTELMHYLRGMKRATYRETIAYIVDVAARPLCGPRLTFGRQFEGIARQANHLGYGVDTFWLGQDGLDGRRLEQVLRSRSIRGVIVGPMLNPALTDGLDWQRYAGVALNHTFARPSLHRVASNQLQTITDVLQACVERGYSRIGLVISPRHDERVRRWWTTGYFGFFSNRSDSSPLPIFWGETEPLYGSRDDAGFVRWFRDHRVEVLVTLVPDWLEVLAAAGYSCPRDYACAVLDKEPLPPYAGLAGVDQHHEVIGTMAVNQLVGALHVGQTGVPEHAHVTLLAGSWVDGSSLPACAQSGGKTKRAVTPVR